jgi:cell division protein ZapA
MTRPNHVQVEIFGQSYTVRSGTDPQYVRDLAAYVDAQMRDIARSGGAVDSVRIAVLAALNIADEAFQARAVASHEKRQAATRAAALASQLATVLEEPQG